MTRPDIAYCVQTLSQFLQQPKKCHMDAAIRVVRYIKKEPSLGVLLSSQVKNEVTAYCDADWASYSNSRKSITGYFVKLGDSIVSWKSKKQNTISRSSAEAEYRSIAATVVELIWLQGLMKEIKVDIELPTVIHTDSKSAMQIAYNPVYHERTKHIEIVCHFIRENINKGSMAVNYIPTKEQPTDILTKGLNRFQHDYLLFKLSMINIFGTI
ncbi:secreted RxLR effector protein 161-like [Capsicum annuum]|uniref:secreted RxLR effector protein 161-like n=1 Tax=Capsicum annuum TaxID=4072 RepID=UPI001FB19FA2|nr:secreted RxLR effector protein 161-like [Capsicum annuum]